MKSIIHGAAKIFIPSAQKQATWVSHAILKQIEWSNVHWLMIADDREELRSIQSLPSISFHSITFGQILDIHKLMIMIIGDDKRPWVMKQNDELMTYCEPGFRL